MQQVKNVTLATLCDNVAMVSWIVHKASKAMTASSGRLLQGHTLFMQHHQVGPLLTVHVAGECNIMADIAPYLSKASAVFALITLLLITLFLSCTSLRHFPFQWVANGNFTNHLAHGLNLSSKHCKANNYHCSNGWQEFEMPLESLETINPIITHWHIPPGNAPADPNWHTPGLCCIHQGRSFQMQPPSPVSISGNSSLACCPNICFGQLHRPMKNGTPPWLGPSP